MTDQSDKFFAEARACHNDRYDYTLSEYVNGLTKITIRCPVHGLFQQIPKSHRKGHGCPKCGGKQADELNFLRRARDVHGDRYDYSQTVFNHSLKKVSITCRAHGPFMQLASNHVRGYNCPKCSNAQMKVKKTNSTQSFIEDARKKHGTRYDYSRVTYTGAKEKVEIVCAEHGVFQQRAHSHLQGNGCPYCSGVIRETARFVEKAISVHQGRYSYELTRYVNSTSKVTVTCDAHGPFEVNASDHLRGSGCRGCMVSHPETMWLNSLSVPKRQHPKRVGPKKKIIVDGYDPSTNTVYEFHGDFWHGNPTIYDQAHLHPVRRITFGEVYRETVAREDAIRSLGMNLISIWECDWKAQHGSQPLPS